MKRSITARIKEKVFIDGLTGCWIFNSGLQGTGYAQMSVNQKKYLVHRLIWIATWGEIPKGMVIDHICKVRNCCNIEHLRLFTYRQNVCLNSNSIQAKNLAKTHCKNGHDLRDPEICGYYQPSNRTFPSRYCKICNSLKYVRKMHAKKILEALTAAV